MQIYSVWYLTCLIVQALMQTARRFIIKFSSVLLCCRSLYVKKALTQYTSFEYIKQSNRPIIKIGKFTFNEID